MPNHRLIQSIPSHTPVLGNKTFLGYMPLVRHERPALAGRMEIPFVEIYDDCIHVEFRYLPDLDVFAEIFREEIDENRRNLKPRPELVPEAQKFAPEIAVACAETVRSLHIRDNVGTRYWMGANSGGGNPSNSVNVSGSAIFYPSLPPTASWFWVSAMGANFLRCDLLDDHSE